MRSTCVTVAIDLERIRSSAETIRARTGAPLIAVVKADAYGLGAARVADALDSVADEFAYFTLDEAIEIRRPGLVMGPPNGNPSDYRELNLRPAVADLESARRYRGVPTAIDLDSGMQRLGARPEDLDELLAVSGASEVFTHAVDVASARLLHSLCSGRGLRLHAAATSLLDYEEAWLDAVRPGLALYRGAVRVTTRLVAVRETSGRVGYGGFECPRVGVILCGYSNRVAPAPVVINGRRQQILETGMNTSFVSVDPGDQVGDEVVLLGEELNEDELASNLRIRPHEILCRYTAMGVRSYAP